MTQHPEEIERSTADPEPVSGEPFIVTHHRPWWDMFRDQALRHFRVSVVCRRCHVVEGYGVTVRAAKRAAAHTDDECRRHVEIELEQLRELPREFGGFGPPGNRRIHEHLTKADGSLIEAFHMPVDLVDVPALAHQVNLVLSDVSLLLRKAADTVEGSAREVVMTDSSDEDPACLARKAAEAFRAATQIDTNKRLLEYAGADVARLGYTNYPSHTAPEGDHP